MASAFYLLIICSNLFFLEFCRAIERNQLSFNESLSNGESLVSLNQRFELGFFSPASTNNKSYLGIWYKNYPDIVAWVANRETPLTDSVGTLTIYTDGNLVLLNSSNTIIWSSNVSLSSIQLQSSSVVHLLDSGNLVLTQNRTSVPEESYVWQSFDYPGVLAYFATYNFVCSPFPFPIHQKLLVRNLVSISDMLK